jgi:hypothetical protein
VVWPIYFSAILLACVFALCRTKGTAPWIWSVINSVLVGLLAMNLVNLASTLEPGDASAHYRLYVWIGTYLGVSGFLYVLAMNETHKNLVGASSEALSWVIATTAGAFCNQVFPDEISWVHGVGVLLTEQLIFYFIWILPRTIQERSLNAWDIGKHKLGVPALEGDPVSAWRAECDGILWGAAPFALAGSLCKLITHVVTNNTQCHKDDLCAWDGSLDARISMWTKFTGLLIVITVLCAAPLQRMIDRSGLSNIAGSTMLSGLTTSISMCFLNVLRSLVTYGLCSRLGMCNHADHPVFGKLLVAYLATMAACGSAMVMATVEEDVTPDSDTHHIMQNMQKSMGLQAGLAWYGVFDAAASTGALAVLWGGDSGGLVGAKPRLAVILLATIFPLYAYHIRPANKAVQAEAQQVRDDRKARKAAHQD